MNSPSLRALRGHLQREVLTLLLFTSLMLQSATAAAPGWWSARQVLTPGATADDYSVANLGQLKSLASKAAAEMNSTLPGGAGTDINTLIATWNAAPGADVMRDDYAALNIGQLKSVVKLFYDRLADAGVTPSGTYPWSGRNADDYALANLGQLKTVFSFEMTTGDANQNGIPDVWELKMFGNLAQSANGDFDQDGLNNLAEYQDGTDPATADTDGDGVSDGQEVAQGTDPTQLPPSASWTQADLDAAAAAYEIGLQQRSRYVFAHNYPFGDPIDPDNPGDYEIQFHSYLDSDDTETDSIWDYDYVSLAGLDASKMEAGGTTAHALVADQTLPDWEALETATLSAKGSATATANTTDGVTTAKSEYRLVRRLREGFTAPVDSKGNLIKPEIKRTYLKVTTITTNSGTTTTDVQMVEFTIPADVPDNDVSTTTSGVLFPPVTKQGTCRISLAPIEAAPQVLRVNTDFDEGKLVNGYAVPDSKETNASQPSLRAERDSLDGRFKKGELVTDDLHQGFFGLLPGSMPDDFFDGAEVLIAKQDTTDADTGRPESGVVRLHATKGEGTSAQHWNISVGGLESGIPQNLVSLLYSSSSQIPRNGVTYWIEGVTGGRITLEFYYKKGTVAFSIEQKFLVCTQQTKAQWAQEIVDQIKLQTSGAEDLSTFIPTNEFTINVPHIKAVYGFYEQLFVEKPEKLMWAGMAKLAGAPVFAGLSDAQWGRNKSLGALDWIAGVKDFQSQLMKGNRVIFDDLGWQHRAFVASGVYALKYVNQKDPAVSLLPVNMSAWNQIEEGMAPGRDPALIKAGSLALLAREQQSIIQPVYEAIKLIDIPLTALGYDDALSVLAENPIPGGLPFSDLVSGNLADFSDRWSWIDGGAEGMFQIWVGDSPKGLNAASRLSNVQISLTNRAQSYANFPSSVP